VTAVRRELLIPRPRDEVFAFFADPRNLEVITPPWLHFRITDLADGPLRTGSTINYSLRIHGIRINWRTLISRFEPPHQFIDEQIRGPYREWVHVHTFEEVDGGTLVRDAIDYRVLGGALIDRLFVRRDVKRIFDYRAEVLSTRFGSRPEPGEPRR